MSEAKLRQIDVVAGLIIRESRILVCQRPPGGNFPLKWEFPGGKVEEGETFEEALRRELREELGIEVQAATELFTHQHTYQGVIKIRLKFFKVHSFKGAVKNLVFYKIDWIAINQLAGLDFLEADLPLINKLTTLETTGSGS
jgi:mutator protein MutT